MENTVGFALLSLQNVIYGPSASLLLVILEVCTPVSTQRYIGVSARLSFSFHLSLPALGDPAALCGDDAGKDAEEEDWQEEDGEAQADGEGDEGGDQRQGDDEEGQGDQQDVAHAPPKHPLEATVQGSHYFAVAIFYEKLH